MTLDELFQASKGQQELMQIQEQAHWERTRWLAALMLQPHAKKGATIQPSSLVSFPWEKERKPNKGEEIKAKQILESWTDGQTS